jgi:hypothetical protein
MGHESGERFTLLMNPRKTSNAEHRTLNVQCAEQFDVRRSMLDVRCFCQSGVQGRKARKKFGAFYPGGEGRGTTVELRNGPGEQTATCSLASPKGGAGWGEEPLSAAEEAPLPAPQGEGEDGRRSRILFGSMAAGKG